MFQTPNFPSPKHNIPPPSSPSTQVLHTYFDFLSKRAHKAIVHPDSGSGIEEDNSIDSSGSNEAPQFSNSPPFKGG